MQMLCTLFCAVWKFPNSGGGSLRQLVVVAQRCATHEVSQTRIAANRDRDAADGTFVSRRIVRKSAVTYSTWPGGVVRALQADGQFKVRALTRNKGKHRELAGEVVEADLNRPETLAAVFKGGTWCISRHHFFVRRNHERKQGAAAAFDGYFAFVHEIDHQTVTGCLQK